MSETERLSEFLRSANSILVFTGAGISTESGIPDYRSRGGLWDRFKPVTYREFLASEEKRAEYWAYKFHFMKEVLKARPNLGHAALAKLDLAGKLKGVITQNIDGLHQLAGIPDEKILELHGTNRRTVCLSCGAYRPWEEVHARLASGEAIPLCLDCGGLLKPATISFGQELDPEVLRQALRWCEACDLMLCVGSTLIVEPAASLPLRAKQHGARLLILNLSETPLDRLADLRLEATAGPVLSSALQTLLAEN